MSSLGPTELIIILAVLLLLFGASRLPKLARSLGESAKELRDGLKDGSKDDTTEAPRDPDQRA